MIISEIKAVDFGYNVDFHYLRVVLPHIILMGKINVESKSNELVSILSNQFRGKINLARIRFIAMFVCALCKAQTVGFDKLACSFDSAALAESNIRKIQRFIAKGVL